MHSTPRLRRWPHLAPFLVALAITLAGFSGSIIAPAPPSVAKSTAAVAERPAFSLESTAAHLQSLSEGIGPRPAGSAAHDQAIAYVSETWRSLGYAPQVTTFQFSGFEEREVMLTVTDSGDRILGSILRGGPGGEASGELVDAGLGRAQDISENCLDGRIALIKRGEIRFSDKIANAANAGAIGVVIDNSEPGGFTGSLSGPSPIPAMGITQEDGRALRRQLSFGSLDVSLRIDGGRTELTAQNVSITKPGSGSGIVIVGAHIDSVPISPGANDNGSGTAVVTELARSIQGRAYPFEIRLVLFGAEEVGLIGSSRYAQQMSEDERERVIAMINLDMVGVGSQWRIGGTPSLVAQGLMAMADIGESATRMGQSLNMSSDHASFIEAGMPGLFIHRTDDPNYHTANDRAEQVDPRLLGAAGRTVLTLLEMFASDTVA